MKRPNAAPNAGIALLVIAHGLLSRVGELGSFGRRFNWRVKVRVIVGLETSAHEKHSQQMRRTASSFTDDESTVEVFQLPDDPTSLVAVFTVPTAAHGDLVSRIEREFWNCVDDVTGPVVTAFSESEPKREIVD